VLQRGDLFGEYTGCLVGRTRIDVPSFTRVVTAATCDRVIIGSVQLTR